MQGYDIDGIMVALQFQQIEIQRFLLNTLRILNPWQPLEKLCGGKSGIDTQDINRLCFPS